MYGNCGHGCDWTNEWRDSGDRGAAQWSHMSFDCPKRPKCNRTIRWEGNNPVSCSLPPHSSGEHME